MKPIPDLVHSSDCSSRSLLFLLLPVMAEQLLVRLVGTADTVMISSAGEAAMSAVALINSLNNVFVHLFTALAMGGAIVSGQHLGANHPELARQTTAQSLILGLLLSSGLTVCLILFQEKILTLTLGSAQIALLIPGQLYFRITIFSLPTLALSSAVSAAFRAVGDMLTPFLLSLGTNLLNIAGNYILLFVCKLGIMGIATATLAARLTGAVVATFLLFRPNYLFHPNAHDLFYPDLTNLRHIIRISLPYAAEDSFQHLGMLLVAGLSASFGVHASAAYAAAKSVGVFQMLPAVAVSVVASPIFAQCFGAKARSSVRRWLQRLLRVAMLGNVFDSLLILAFLPWLSQMFHLSQKGEGLFRWMLWINGIACILLWPPAFLFSGLTRASGASGIALAVNLISMWVFQVALSFLLTQLGYGPQSIWLGMGASWLAQTLLLAAWLHTKTWQRRWESDKR